jgi:hypothetical protein
MSRRKTYRKKKTAKRARRKGQAIYKVKGGYRIRRDCGTCGRWHR